jgi:cold shock CspA family protein
MTRRKSNKSFGYGYGMSPDAEITRRYGESARIVADVLAGHAHMDFPELADAISKVKGLFNRSLRQNQPDWFSVWERLGRPDPSQLSRIANDLVQMRNAVKSENLAEFEYTRERLQRNGALTALRYFVQDDAPYSEEGAGSIYILQELTDKNERLKIGFTTDSIFVRVAQINSATGVSVPYGARHAWRVRNPQLIEKKVHDLLAEYRVNDRREFFDLDFRQAVSSIDALITELQAEVRERGTVKRILREKGYGFLGSDGLDFFFHCSQVEPSFDELREGDEVEFDRAETSDGLKAVRVRICDE